MATGIDESWERVATHLEASSSVTERLNGALVRSVTPSVAVHVRVALSKQRLLFVPREVLPENKAYVLASFMDSETYDFALVVEGAVRRADRCGTAIRHEVLEGFLRDLIIATTPKKEDSKEGDVPEVQGEPGAATNEVSLQENVPSAQALLPNGWVMPPPSRLV